MNPRLILQVRIPVIHALWQNRGQHPLAEHLAAIAVFVLLGFWNFFCFVGGTNILFPGRTSRHDTTAPNRRASLHLASTLCRRAIYHRAMGCFVSHHDGPSVPGDLLRCFPLPIDSLVLPSDRNTERSCIWKALASSPTSPWANKNAGTFQSMSFESATPRQPLLLATRNVHKTLEVRAILGPAGASRICSASLTCPRSRRLV